MDVKKNNKFQKDWHSATKPLIFAAPRLIVQTMPIQSAVVSGRGKRIIPRWRPN